MRKDLKAVVLNFAWILESPGSFKKYSPSRDTDFITMSCRQDVKIF